MKLTPGTRLGPYEIVAIIGKGGMGEVYRAKDTRLGRDVAIKVSSREFNDRFEREAHAISALNHPNICTLHDIGPNYLVMEFIEGDTLSKLIEGGPLPLDKALAYAAQIVDALSAAHAKGIVHRDLKPGNIVITKNGAKVLDFGLAKLSTERQSSDSSGIETVTEPITKAGAILGTLYYMAPEQVEGRETDERSDIFSFGAVLYEMVTGQRPFTGDTQAAVLAAILKDPPPSMHARQPATPRALERLVRKCLEKKPDDRWHSARDLKPAIELIDLDATSLNSASASSTVPVQIPAQKRGFQIGLWPMLAAAVVLVGLLAAAGWALWLKPAPAARASRFEVTLPEGVQFSQYVSLSPDGRKLVFNATGEQSGLWVRDLDTLQWRHLAGTEGSSSPFWSPDSRFLGFSVSRDLKKIEVAGGPPQTLCTEPSNVGTGAWSPEGVIIFGGKGGTVPLRRVSAAGGVATDITALDTKRGENFHALPYFLPDGKQFVYLITGSEQIQGVYAGSLDAKPAEQPRERILASKLAAPYADGHLFFLRDGTLMAQPFDTAKLQLTGDPVPVAERVGAELSAGYFAVSPAGVLAYRTGSNATGGFQHAWFDRQGKQTGIFGDLGPDTGAVLSPDGTRAAGRDAGASANGDVWLLDFARGVRTRLTFRQAPGSQPVWSADGTRIAFSGGNNADTIFEKSASGASDEKELFKKPGAIMVPTSWSPDGRFLLFYITNEQGGGDMYVLPLDEGKDRERKPALLLGTQFAEGQAVFSPDGRWVAYTSVESGRGEVYVRPFVASGPSLGEGKWQVSKDGGSRAHWTSGGKEIVFRNGAVWMAVDVSESGSAFQMGTPKELFRRPIPFGDGWDITADGKRLLLIDAPGQQQAQPTPITVVLNWQADLKK